MKFDTSAVTHSHSSITRCLKWGTTTIDLDNNMFGETLDDALDDDDVANAASTNNAAAAVAITTTTLAVAFVVVAFSSAPASLSSLSLSSPQHASSLLLL